MAYLLEAGIQVSINYNPSTGSGTWYKLTDHNRDPIDISTELIETQSRMANGRMKKYVIAQKNTITASWTYVPSKTSETVDLNYSAAWLELFYKSNVGSPVYLKVISSKINQEPSLNLIPSDFNFKDATSTSTVYYVFMNNFSKAIVNRTKLSDYVDMSIDFTEI
jgi:hypothetical protein